MGILDRFADIIKANINDLLDKAEDPAKMIDQYMREVSDIETLNARRETIKAKAAVANTQAKVNQFTSGNMARDFWTRHRLSKEKPLSSPTSEGKGGERPCRRGESRTRRTRRTSSPNA